MPPKTVAAPKPAASRKSGARPLDPSKGMKSPVAARAAPIAHGEPAAPVASPKKAPAKPPGVPAVHLAAPGAVAKPRAGGKRPVAAAARVSRRAPMPTEPRTLRHGRIRLRALAHGIPRVMTSAAAKIAAELNARMAEVIDAAIVLTSEDKRKIINPSDLLYAYRTVTGDTLYACSKKPNYDISGLLDAVEHARNPSVNRVKRAERVAARKERKEKKNALKAKAAASS